MAAESNIITTEEISTLDNIVSKYKGKEGCLINVLHETQEALGYIPYNVQKYLAEKLDIALSEIYGVVTFYSRFTLNPTGKYKVGICLGTACYVKGADKLLENAQNNLGIKAGETSEDGLFSIEATRCIGACGLAPVLTVNEDVYGKLAPEDIDGILAKYKE